MTLKDTKAKMFKTSDPEFITGKSYYLIVKAYEAESSFTLKLN